MKYYKEKLFWNIIDNKKNIFFEKFDETQGYHSFIKKMINNQCHQIAITSDIMISYIETIASTNNINIEKVELMEEDDELNQKIKNLVNQCKFNRGSFVELIKALRHLDEESSIDIKSIYLNEDDILGYIQVNGIVGITQDGSKFIELLLQCLKEYLIG